MLSRAAVHRIPGSLSRASSRRTLLSVPSHLLPRSGASNRTPKADCDSNSSAVAVPMSGAAAIGPVGGRLGGMLAVCWLRQVSLGPCLVSSAPTASALCRARVGQAAGGFLRWRLMVRERPEAWGAAAGRRGEGTSGGGVEACESAKVPRRLSGGIRVPICILGLKQLFTSARVPNAPWMFDSERTGGRRARQC